MKLLLKFVVFTAFLGMFTCYTSFAQTAKLQNSLGKIIKLDEHLFKTDPNLNNRNFMAFFGINVNSLGLVDTVVHNVKDNNQETDQLSRLINFAVISAALKSDKKSFVSYKNEFVVLIIYLRRGDESVVKNGGEIERNFSDLYDQINKVKNKKVILLSPWIYSFNTKSIKN